jgi:hypothetical protein
LISYHQDLKCWCKKEYMTNREDHKEKERRRKMGKMAKKRRGKK